IRTDNPPRRNFPARVAHDARRYSLHCRLPAQLHAADFCPLQQFLMQQRPPYSDALPRGEFGAHLRVLLHEADPSESAPILAAHRDPQLSQGLLRLSQKSFAASLVNRRLQAINDNDRKAFLACRNSRRESCRPSANHAYICSFHALMLRLQPVSAMPGRFLAGYLMLSTRGQIPRLVFNPEVGLA